MRLPLIATFLALAAAAAPHVHKHKHAPLLQRAKLRGGAAERPAAPVHAPARPAAASTASSLAVADVQYVNLTLNEPVFQTMTVPAGMPLGSQWTYYSFLYDGSGAAGFSLYIGELAGQVDMFVGGPSQPLPTPDNYAYGSAALFADRVEVPASACTEPPCQFYIGVSPFPNANVSYYIVAEPLDGAVGLTNGLPRYDVATVAASSAFNFTFTASYFTDYVTFSVEAITGTPFTAVTLGGGCSCRLGDRAAAGDFSLTGSGLITVSAASPAFQAANCVIGQPCAVSISVGVAQGWADTTRFYLTAATTTVTTTLIDGVPAPATVSPGMHRYFAFTVPAPVDAVALQLGVTAGAPAFAMSWTNPTPSVYNCTYMFFGPGDGTVMLSDASPNFPSTFPVTIYIGVQSAAPNTTSSFFITPAQHTTPNATITLLADGQPQSGYIAPPWTFQYFALQYNGTSYGGPDGQQLVDGLQVTASATTGSLDVYVATGVTTSPVTGLPVPILPTLVCAASDATGACSDWVVDPATYSWTSGATTGLVDIPPSALVLGQTYIVGVLATYTSATPPGPFFANPTVFSVVASTPATVTQLQQGVSMLVGLGGFEQRLFSYTVGVPGADILITSLAFTGGAVLNVSESMGGLASSSWTAAPSALAPSSALLTIPYNQLSPACRFAVAIGTLCHLLIAVTAAPENSTIELTAGAPSTVAAPTVLSNGKATLSMMTTEGVQYLYAWMWVPEGESLMLSVQDWGASSTTMYVNFGPGRGWYQPGGSVAYNYVSTGVGGYNELLLSSNGLGSTAHAQGMGALDAEGATLPLRRVATAPGGRVVLGLPERNSTFSANASAGAPLPPAADGPPGPEPPYPPPGLHYCTGYCPLYVTITGAPNTLFSVSLSSGPTLQTIADAVPSLGWAPADYSYTYFSYTPLTPVLPASILQLTTYTGSVDVFVSPQNPAAPYLMPSATNFTYATSSWGGTAMLTVPYAPAYLIAVRSSTPNNGSAYFSLLARSLEEFRATPLQDGTPVDGLAISTLMPAFYTYQLPQAGAGVPAPPVIVSFTSFFGSPVLHVTNEPFGPHAVTNLLSGQYCEWSTANATGGQLILDSSSPCYSPDATAYTFAVNGLVGMTPSTVEAWPYQLTVAAQQPDAPPVPRRLTAGVPSTGLLVAAGTALNFLFEVTTPGQDVLVTVTPEGGGNLALLVTYLNDTAATPPPSCTHANGSQVMCTGWTWMATTTLYIPGATPCTPLAGEGSTPATAQQPDCAALLPGRYWATVYSTSNAAFSIGVQAGAQQPMLLADGVPQISQTANLTVCPTRDPVSGTCADPDVSPLSRVASQSFFRFVVPATDIISGLVSGSYLTVERMCPGGVAGDCGLPLHVMLRGCAAPACTQDDQYPSSQSATLEADFYVNSAQASLLVPAPASFNQNATNYVYYIGVAPVCGSAATPGWNGLDCPSVVPRVTWSSPASIDRIPPDCTASGRTCVLPWQTVSAAPAVRRVEAFLGLGPTETALVTATACFGDSQMSVCQPNAGATACNPQTLPGPTNNDFTGYTFGSGAVLWKDTGAGPLFVGLNAVGAATTTVAQLSITSSAAPQFILFYNTLTATRVGTNANITFASPRVMVPGAQPVMPVGVVYTAYAFPVSDILPGFRLSVACGVQYAATQAAGVLTASAIDTLAIVIPGLDPNTPYSLAVVATCPAGTCLAGQASDQSVAYTATTVGPSLAAGAVANLGGARPVTRPAQLATKL